MARHLGRARRLAGPPGEVAGAVVAGSDLRHRGSGPGRYSRPASSSPLRCRSWIAVRCASSAG